MQDTMQTEQTTREAIIETTKQNRVVPPWPGMEAPNDRHMGYLCDDLRALYAEICNPADHRAQVFVPNVAAVDVGLIVTCLQFMTGAQVKSVHTHGDLSEDLYCVGYRLGPCGP